METQAAILTSVGLIQIEWDALGRLNGGEYDPLPLMARKLIEHYDLFDPFAAHFCEVQARTRRDYRNALKALLARGWLRIVDDAPSVATLPGLVPGNALPQVGDLDFTDVGYQRASRIALYLDIAWEPVRIWEDREACALHHCCADRAESERWLTRCLTSSRFVSEKPVRVLRHQEPTPTGLWWFRVQQSFPQGWHTIVHFQRLRRKRVLWPELGLDGWLEPHTLPYVIGTLRGECFSFDVDLLRYQEGNPVYYVSLWVNQDEVWFTQERMSPFTTDELLRLLRIAAEACQDVQFDTPVRTFDTPVRTTHGPSQARADDAGPFS